MTRILILVSSALLAVTALGADLPIREVILYKHGVGYFVRAGELRPGEAARLDFKASEMNDVLKSLTIEDKNGGKVTGVRYDSSEPLAQKLSDFPFRVDGQQSLSAFLDQMKGGRVELKYGAETVSGIIVSARITRAEEKQPEREQVILLLDSGEIRTFDLAAATAIRLSDPAAQRQLKDYLLTLSQSRSKEKRSVYIDSSVDKVRQIVTSYMVPTPIWKSSYRLIFGERSDPTLEGWAILDNTTGEDWNSVRLVLVSGRPISFISRLYEARYNQRPIAELAEERAQAPVVYEGGIQQAEKAARVGGAVGRGLAAGAPAPASAPKSMMAKEADSELRRDEAVALDALKDYRTTNVSAVAATAQARELGELFEYRFSSPVTVRKSESSMLPFLQQQVAARKLLIYTDGSGRHPMNAAEISNSTGKTLDGGPITVFDANAYAGEALMETLKASDKRLISYAVDLGTRITTAFDSSRDYVREVHFRRGILTTRSAVQETNTYTVHNVDQKAKTLIIEHPQRPEYKVLNQKPIETTSGAYRFEVKLAPGATEKFPLKEERLYETSTAITDLTPDVLVTYLQNKALAESARKQLEQLFELKRQLATADAGSQRLETDLNELVRDQERIRQNIYSLNQVSGQQEQVQKYSRQLAGQETKLAGMRDQLSELRRKKAGLESQLKAAIEKMEF